MISSYHLQNFINDDCLKDFLYAPAPEPQKKIVLSNKTFTETFDILQPAFEFYGAYKLSLATKWVAIIKRTTPIKKCLLHNAYTNLHRYNIRELAAEHLEIPTTDITVLELDPTTKKYTSPHINVGDAVDIIDRGMQWLEILRTEREGWVIDGAYPPHLFLLPNVTLPFQDEFTEVREKLAWQWQDIGLLYYIGAQTRFKLHRLGIYTLNHPKLFEGLKSLGIDVNILQIQKIMHTKMMLPVGVSPPLPSPFLKSETSEQFAYLDIETTDTLHPQVHVVGIFYYNPEIDNFDFVHFDSRDTSSIDSSSTWMAQNIPNHTIVHYTSADCLAIPSTYKRLDLYDIIQEQFLSSVSLQALHLNCFKLKTIYKNLCLRCGLKNLYDDCSVKNGLQAMHKLDEWILNPKVSIAEVIRYNRVDCIALKALHMYLTNVWDYELEKN